MYKSKSHPVYFKHHFDSIRNKYLSCLKYAKRDISGGIMQQPFYSPTFKCSYTLKKSSFRICRLPRCYFHVRLMESRFRISLKLYCRDRLLPWTSGGISIIFHSKRRKRRINRVNTWQRRKNAILDEIQLANNARWTSLAIESDWSYHYWEVSRKTCP